MIHLGWTAHFLKLHQIVQLNQLPLIGADVERGQIHRRVAVGAVYLTNDLILLAIHQEVSQPPVTQGQLQRLGHVLHRNAQVRCFLAVDADVQFGLVEFQVDVGVLESWVFLYLIQERRQFFPEFLKVQVLNHELNGQSTAPAHLNGLVLGGKHPGFVEVLEVFGQVIDNRPAATVSARRVPPC